MLFKNLREEVDTVLAKDPAARSRLEVVLCYPGFHSMLFYRVAHWLWSRNWLVLGRFVSHLGRLMTGIEIHPGAKIGRRLFIDHGMGVVIGETAEIGDDVTLYQGVTLGGTSLHHEKRHPTLGDGVIVGSGAQILGGFTVGRDARVGANAVVVAEVPPGVTVVGIPAKPVGAPRPAAAKTVSDFLPYGTPCDEIPDPVARVLNGLLDEVQSLRARLQDMEHRAEAGRSAPLPLPADEPALAERRTAQVEGD
ncbi:MAG TPA: serine O-acetyltransferase [Stellaceae bacterium]|jgi:serine O-acetyltransferase|nr:serine O-acetyltransferase [Stellaceae bacterium]